MDEVFRALADPSRRRLLDSLNAPQRPDPARALRRARHGPPVGQQAPRHPRGGQPRHHRPPRPGEAPLPQRGAHQRDRRALDHAATTATASTRSPTSNAHWRTPPWTDPSFVYTTYIRTTPERLWQALTDPAFTRRYWGATFETDWKPGSHDDLGPARRHDRRPRAGRARVRPVPPALLHLAHVHARSSAESLDFTDDVRARLAAEPRSKVTFEIEPLGDAGEADGRPRRLRARQPRRLDGQPAAGRASSPASRRCSRPARRLPRTGEPPLPVRLGLTTRPTEATT